jgi:hypothetical protein
MKIGKISRLDFTLQQVIFAVVDKGSIYSVSCTLTTLEIILILTELNTLVKDIMATPAEVIYLLILWKRL